MSAKIERMFKNVLVALCIVTLSSASLSGKVSTLSSAASRANERSLESKDDIAWWGEDFGGHSGEDFGGHSRADRSCSVNGCRKIPDDQTLCNSLFGFLTRFPGLRLGSEELDSIVNELGISRGQYWMAACTEFFRNSEFDNYAVPDWLINSWGGVMAQ